MSTFTPKSPNFRSLNKIPLLPEPGGLLADDRTALKDSFAVSAMTDALWVFVPTVERLAFEKLDPVDLHGD